MTRSHSMRRLVVAVTLGATLCAMTQSAPAAAAKIPVLPKGAGHTLTIDVRTGELLSVTSTTPLDDAVVKQFDTFPGPKTYTLDVSTGRYLSIVRN